MRKKEGKEERKRNADGLRKSYYYYFALRVRRKMRPATTVSPFFQKKKRKEKRNGKGKTKRKEKREGARRRSSNMSSRNEINPAKLNSQQLSYLSKQLEEENNLLTANFQQLKMAQQKFSVAAGVVGSLANEKNGT